MAHMIERNEDMFSVRQIPWHGLGIILDNPPTSEEAIIHAGLNWDVEQRDVYRKDNYGMLQHEAGFFCNVRSDNDRVLGFVTDRYEIIQNTEAFKFTDNLLATGDVTYETAGCLQGGKKIWLLAKLPSKHILGDQTDTYLCFTHGHDGNTAIRCAITGIRVVCNNTLNFAIKNATRIWSTKHVGNIHSKMEDARITLGMADYYMDSVKYKAEKLYRYKLDMDKVVSLTHRLMPIPEDATDRTVKNIMNQQNDLLYRFSNAPDLKNFRKTGWGYVMAVSDYVTHGEPTRKTQNYKENRFANLISGGTLIDKAVELIAA